MTTGSGTRGSALRALCGLLDASVEQIAAASADARTYDRGLIARTADVWDNNTWPLFHVLSARTPWGREHRARAALRSMAGLGESRRAWMTETAAARGERLERLVPSMPGSLYARDFRGQVRPWYDELGAGVVAELAEDYDLGSATVRALRVERAGSRLTAAVVLEIARRFPMPDVAVPPATLSLRWHTIDGLAFDSREATGVRIPPGEGGVAETSAELGAAGLLSGRDVTLRLDDNHWHRSAAGRRADGVLPPNRPDESRRDLRTRRFPADAVVAARLLHRAVLEIRGVRHPRRAARVPVADFCRALDGAGTELLDAARTGAFAPLVDRWAGRGGPRLARWFAATTGAPAEWPAAVEPARAPWQPGRGELRFLSYARAEGTAEAGLELLYAAPAADGSWRLRSWCGPAPARFRLRYEAFRRVP
ncbi:hypothetical protein ABH931_003273 [Streptacidiphilus sp. MAP12-33]|uniref:hypothetical protein n=1 Tax=Streptacidiphilus sp. MAP12-33 TaxID=3156266 RepID=UPI0035131EEB